MTSQEFQDERRRNLEGLAGDSRGHELAIEWMVHTAKHKYSYNFNWLGRPIIQYPQDILALQEIIFDVKPDVIIETGIAHGGSLIFHASILRLLGNNGRVIGIDIDIREHNRKAIESHFLYPSITLIEGSSTDSEVVERVFHEAKAATCPLVILDSNHTHEHVLAELQLYSPLVRKGSYVIVFDTVVEDFPDAAFQDRPWGKGNNPKTAVKEFMESNDRFEVDKDVDAKLMISVGPSGYLHCVKNP